MNATSKLIVPGSFTQDQKHSIKSDRFVPIQPSQLATVMADHGFDMVHLKSGRGRNPDRKDFQTTIARYRSRDAFEVQGLAFDIILKVPHLYGSMQAVLGLFRGVCANQLNVGQHFANVKVRHTGQPMELLNELIPALVAQREQLVGTITAMQARDVTPREVVELAQRVAQIRLCDANAINVQVQDIIRPRRMEDAGNDLFTVMNVLQENVMRYGLRYQTVQAATPERAAGIRNLRTHKVREQGASALQLNGSIWDAAANLLVAG